jgi:hypothetical protein
MQYNGKASRGRLHIANVWEVHLDFETWGRLRSAAEKQKCTYSWISRYCVFRLIRKKNIRMHKAMEFHSNNLRKMVKNNSEYHRHLLCLYGEDEKLLTLAFYIDRIF